MFAVAAMITASSLALWFRNILFAVGYSTLGAIPLQIGADIFGSLWYFISITNMMSCLFVACKEPPPPPPVVASTHSTETRR